jgi:superfamily II DNA or RNA helicase
MTAAPVTRPLGLRAWQAEALRQYHEATPRDFLISATPGAGKTRFGLRVAADLLESHVVQRVIVVTPTDHLRTQWAEAANAAGVPLDPAATNAVGPISRDYVGAVVTYAQVASHPMLHRARVEARRSLVILDEVHHAGDNRSWGEALRDAVDPAARRLALSGTPFRSSPDEKIPYVRYVPDGEYTLRSVPDYVYGYRQALAEQVVRPVMFCAYSGLARWRNSAGEVMAAQLGQVLTREETQAAWRTALNPAGEWMSAVLTSADARLDEHRLSGMPDAGGMVLAADQDHARAYAALLARITGREPVVVLSDEEDASRRIEAFRDSTDRWMVAVRMVSEGVDIPRLAVGVYATSAQTPLFFAQAIGRFVRARRRGESATVFLPSVAPLLVMAAELEEERDHVVRLVERQPDDELEVGISEAPERRASALGTFEPLDSEAAFSHVLFGGEAHTGDDHTGVEDVAPEDEDFLGLPGLLTPEQTAALLRRREAEQRQRGVPLRPAEAADDVAPHLAVAKLRREVNSLVAQYAHRTGRPHRQVHVEVREACGGPASAKATLAQLATRRDWLLQRLG